MKQLVLENAKRFTFLARSEDSDMLDLFNIDHIPSDDELESMPDSDLLETMMLFSKAVGEN